MPLEIDSSLNTVEAAEVVASDNAARPLLKDKVSVLTS